MRTERTLGARGTVVSCKESPYHCGLSLGDPAFEAVAGSLDDLLDGRRYVGRAPEQVEEFLEAEVDPLLSRYADIARTEAEIRV